MLKSSGTQEKKKHILQQMQLLRLVLIEVEKSKDLIFHLIIPFLAINKLRRSAYLCTPSGNPKLKLWLSLLIPKLFSYPLVKAKAV